LPRKPLEVPENCEFLGESRAYYLNGFRLLGRQAVADAVSIIVNHLPLGCYVASQGFGGSTDGPAAVVKGLIHQMSRVSIRINSEFPSGLELKQMSGRFRAVCAVCSILVLLQAGASFAQGRGGQGRFGQGGGGQSWDANGDGMVTAAEVPDRMRERFQTALKEAGKDPNSGVSMEEARTLMFSGGGRGGRGGNQQQDDNSSGNDRRSKKNKDKDNSDENKKSDTPANTSSVQGFGAPSVKSSETSVKGFGMEVKPNTPTTTSSSSDSNSDQGGKRNRDGGGRDNGGRGGDPSEFALRGMLGQLDKNGNGQLEKSEWAERPELESADTNKDGTITSEELKAFLASGGGGRGFGRGRGFGGPGGPGGGPQGRGGGSDNSGTEDDASHQGAKSTANIKPKRSLMPTERLPKGLPDWFYRNDKDGDGQISMAEFATSWNESELARFNSFDANSDGFLTAAEVLKSLEKKR
jgi:Ca2+-binding EF-hand superfamily protein